MPILDGDLLLDPLGEEKPLDVACLGHALVDRLAEADEHLVRATGLEFGAMTLVGGDEAARLEGVRPDWREVAGGSAANTAAGIASLGARSLFLGSVGDDAAGRRYVADLEAAGVRCVAPTAQGLPTGVCHVLVSPGGERSMATSLGAAGALSPAAVEEADLARAKIVYVEGYLLDAPAAAAALERALATAAPAGTFVALTLSDPFVVERHRASIRRLLDEQRVDLLFGNEEEVLSLTGTSTLVESVRTLASGELCAVITRGAEGSLAVFGEVELSQAAAPVREVVDTTGAGDLFAAGVLGALTTGRPLGEALGLGALAAAEVIGHFGARPETSLAALAESRPG